MGCFLVLCFYRKNQVITSREEEAFLSLFPTKLMQLLFFDSWVYAVNKETTAPNDIYNNLLYFDGTNVCPEKVRLIMDSESAPAGEVLQNTDSPRPFCDILINDHGKTRQERRTEFKIDDLIGTGLVGDSDDYFEKHPFLLAENNSIAEVISKLAEDHSDATLLCKYSMFYRFTGLGRPTELMEKIPWDKEKESYASNLIYIVKQFSVERGKYTKIDKFFDAKLPQDIKSGYASISHTYEDYFRKKLPKIYKK